MPSPTAQARDDRKRKAQAHACPGCHQPWAVRGSRHPSGAWIFLCRHCEWRRVVVTKDRRRTPRAA